MDVFWCQPSKSALWCRVPIISNPEVVEELVELLQVFLFQHLYCAWEEKLHLEQGDSSLVSHCYLLHDPEPGSSKLGPDAPLLLVPRSKEEEGVGLKHGDGGDGRGRGEAGAGHQGEGAVGVAKQVPGTSPRVTCLALFGSKGCPPVHLYCLQASGWGQTRHCV